jgi:hypothetical protein
MSTGDKRPSIAALQQIESDLTADFDGAAIRSAAPALMEIAAAALALGPVLVYLEGPLSDRLRDALAKVRP